jgi:hypothetical protein
LTETSSYAHRNCNCSPALGCLRCSCYDRFHSTPGRPAAGNGCSNALMPPPRRVRLQPSSNSGSFLTQVCRFSTHGHLPNEGMRTDCRAWRAQPTDRAARWCCVRHCACATWPSDTTTLAAYPPHVPSQSLPRTHVRDWIGSLRLGKDGGRNGSFRAAAARLGHPSASARRLWSCPSPRLSGGPGSGYGRFKAAGCWLGSREQPAGRAS